MSFVKTTKEVELLPAVSTASKSRTVFPSLKVPAGMETSNVPEPLSTYTGVCFFSGSPAVK